LLAAQGTRSSALQYTGAQTDLDTGLVYLRARWYDSATGRFTTRDPFPGFAALPQTLHPYVYVNNNPVNLTDPSGEIADIFWDLAIFGVDLLLLFFDSINPTLDECTREQLLSLDRIALGLDLAAIAVPFIPGGSGLAGRLAGRGILILAQGGARASVRAIRVSVQAGVQAGVHASAMTKGSSRGTRGSVGGGGSSGWRPLGVDDLPSSYKPPKGGPRKVRVEFGPYKGRFGWLDAAGDIWVPSKAGESHGGVHWDVQINGGKGGHRNVFP
jgi:RHS repeat-associated protein